jgi:hypothetical protein
MFPLGSTFPATAGLNYVQGMQYCAGAATCTYYGTPQQVLRATVRM